VLQRPIETTLFSRDVSGFGGKAVRNSRQFAALLNRVDSLRAGDSGALRVVTENERFTRIFSGECAVIRAQFLSIVVKNAASHTCLRSPACCISDNPRERGEEPIF